MNSVIIPRVFNGRKIFFDKQDNLVYLNATKTAKEFNKRLDSWQKSPQTIEYVDALQDSFPEYTNSGNGGFIVVRKGGNDKEAQGTWIHPKLIIFFARWLSPHFAVWCDLQIEEIVKWSKEFNLGLPETYEELIEIEEIIAQVKSITYPPESIGNLSNLEKLDFIANPLLASAKERAKRLLPIETNI